MDQKERTILVLKAMIEANELSTKEVMKEKLEACMNLKRPDKVLLTEKSFPVYRELKREAKEKGKIV